jgi:hypothetical protein
VHGKSVRNSGKDYNARIACPSLDSSDVGQVYFSLTLPGITTTFDDFARSPASFRMASFA